MGHAGGAYRDVADSVCWRVAALPRRSKNPKKKATTYPHAVRWTSAVGSSLGYVVCRNVEVPLTPKLFEAMRDAQTSGASMLAEDALGVQDLGDFMQMVDVLRRCARHVITIPRLEPELRWRDPGATWVTAFVHMCEVGGLCRLWDRTCIEAVRQQAKAAEGAEIGRLLQTIASSTMVRQVSVTLGLAMAVKSVISSQWPATSSNRTAAKSNRATVTTTTAKATMTARRGTSGSSRRSVLSAGRL